MLFSIAKLAKQFKAAPYEFVKTDDCRLKTADRFKSRRFELT